MRPRRGQHRGDQRQSREKQLSAKSRARDDFVGDAKHEDENYNNRPENDHKNHAEANEQDQHWPRRRDEKSPRKMSPPRRLNATSFESRARQATKIIAPTARQSKRIRPEASGNWSPPSTRLVLLLLMATTATCYCSFTTSTTPRQRENQSEPPGWTSHSGKSSSFMLGPVRVYMTSMRRAKVSLPRVQQRWCCARSFVFTQIVIVGD